MTRSCTLCKRAIEPHESAYKTFDGKRFCSMKCVAQQHTDTNQQAGKQ